VSKSNTMEHPFLDMTQQRYQLDCDKRRKHEEWVQSHVSRQRFDVQASRTRALLLVSEAYRLEKEHLGHQISHCKKLLRLRDRMTASPQRIRCESSNARDCPCIRAPVYRQLTPKYRAMNLLLPHFQDYDLEPTVDTLVESYSSEHEMIEDLLQRYGPEENDVDPSIWLRSIECRQSNLEKKWTQIAQDVKDEFGRGDNFPVVIRNLSIMRIFLEGSQAPKYSCDMTERSRRDAFHHSILAELNRQGTLFIGEQ